MRLILNPYVWPAMAILVMASITTGVPVVNIVALIIERLT